MSEDATKALARLEKVLADLPPLAIAVSGGVDSMTLASVAHRAAPGKHLMIHAISPAVPGGAGPLIEQHGQAEGWSLRLIDAGEQDDPSYRANPSNRCYFCKSNLYGTMRAATDRLLASGTNLDDLSDVRPGLLAAREHDVVHPFVIAEINKAGIRAIARHFGFEAFAELPAQPCLASRIETGIPIDLRDLTFIDRTERQLRARLGAGETLRVRVRRAGVQLEIGRALAPGEAAEITAMMVEACAADGRLFAGLAPYRVGSAFLRAEAAE
ncbi:adenine nucleotide alpha hydrolase [Xanthobacteraceae bacterium A53D]